jgi:cytochrome P450
VLGYEAAKEVFAAPDRFSSAPYEFVDRTMLSADPPRHGPVRRIVSRAFDGEALRAAELLAEETAIALFRPRMEVVRGYARPVSRGVAASLIGFDAEALTTIARVEDGAQASGAPDGFGQVCAILDALAPRAAMFSRFSEDGAPFLGPEDVRSLVRLLWLASTATTERTLSHAVLRLVEDPALHERLREEPKLIPSFVEEVVRLNPPENLIRRRAVAATHLAGASIPAGAELNICLPAANRDPSVFDGPAELRLDRTGKGNLSFGSGIHHCVGAPLTRRVVGAAVGAFIRASGAPRIHGEVKWLHAMIVRAPSELRIAA